MENGKDGWQGLDFLRWVCDKNWEQWPRHRNDKRDTENCSLKKGLKNCDCFGMSLMAIF